MIDAVSWSEFLCSDVFVSVTPTWETYHSLADLPPSGTVPVVAHSRYNNGVIGFGDEKQLVPGKTITVERKTTANVFYHEYDYAVYDQIIILALKDGTILERVLGLFLVASLRYSFTLPNGCSKHDFMDKINPEKLFRTKIFLPTTQDGAIDYRFMEKYITDTMIDINSKIFVSLMGNK